MIRTIIIAMVICFVALYIGAGKVGMFGQGVVIVEGYQHGVAILDKCEDSPVEYVGDAYLWCSNGIFYTVNTGHLQDPQVQQLIEKAEIQKELLENNQ